MGKTNFRRMMMLRDHEKDREPERDRLEEERDRRERELERRLRKLEQLLAKLDETLSDRVHTIRILLPYDKLGLAAPMRERGSVQLEEYREDGLYLEGIVKTEDLHCFEGYLV